MKPSHWRIAAFVFLALITALGMWDLRSRGAREAELLRKNQVAACEATNDTRNAIETFLGKTVQPPDPESYDYITDPVLREGVIKQATERYNNTKRFMQEAFRPRDCGALFPKEEL